MNNSEKWQKELEFLSDLIHRTELEKTRKWENDVYTIKNRNVLMFGSFKNYVSVWFFNGVFLKDPYQVLVNAQEGKTKALRHWQFTSIDEIEAAKIMEYIQEAIENEKKGLRWKPEKSEEVEIPKVLEDALNADKNLKIAFEALATFKQKEYVEHIFTAKREVTKLSRLEKIKPLIFDGVGLNDKYRK